MREAHIFQIFELYWTQEYIPAHIQGQYIQKGGHPPSRANVLQVKKKQKNKNCKLVSK